MSAEPISLHEDPLDPERILSDLPGEDREFFLAQYREAAEDAVNPAGWKDLQRFLRLWRHHADAADSPRYREARDEALAGTGAGMFLDDYVRERRRG